MALSLTTIRNGILTSLFGRRIGLKSLVASDANSEGLVGFAGSQFPITDATSDTTGTNITGYGITTVDTTTNDTWLLDAPIQGVEKTLYFGSTSTGIRTVMRGAATFTIRTTAESTNTTIVVQAGGQTIRLLGITSTLYGILSKPASTEHAFNGTT